MRVPVPRNINDLDLAVPALIAPQQPHGRPPRFEFNALNSSVMHLLGSTAVLYDLSNLKLAAGHYGRQLKKDTLI